jgi:hypothetical protein
MLRARPAAAFALLNHILINGFFFSQGFAIVVPSNIALVFVQSRKLRQPGGLLVSQAVFVHLESFALKFLLVALVAGLLRWLALLILYGVVVHFELFRHRVSLRTQCWTSHSLASL